MAFYVLQLLMLPGMYIYWSIALEVFDKTLCLPIYYARTRIMGGNNGDWVYWYRANGKAHVPAAAGRRL